MELANLTERIQRPAVIGNLSKTILLWVEVKQGIVTVSIPVEVN